MPARAPNMTTIGYIGVVPVPARPVATSMTSSRGELRSCDTTCPSMVVRTDTDLANRPMAAAFERAGYQQFATRREFELATLNR